MSMLASGCLWAAVEASSSASMLPPEGWANLGRRRANTRGGGLMPNVCRNHGAGSVFGGVPPLHRQPRGLIFRNVAKPSEELHNAQMRLAELFGGFLQLIGVGVLIVLAVVLGIRLGLPQRSAVAVRRRSIE